MKPRGVLTMAVLAFGTIIGEILGTSLIGSPVGWTKTTLLESWKASPSIVHAGSLETRNLETTGIQMAKNIRPAAKGESPEEVQLKQLPPPVPPGQLRRPSKAELLDKCTKNPKCNAKFQASQKRGNNKPRPAAREESPEDIELKKLPKPLSPINPRLKPRSDLMLEEDSQPLLSWINPFQAAPVYAQSGVSINLTPAGPNTSNGYMNLYGGRVYADNRFWLSSTDSWNNTTAENKPYAHLRFSVPTTGTYLINIRAGRGKAKIRHLSNGPIIDTWDFTAQPYGQYDYLTAEYLEQGSHYFYFWPDGGTYFYIYSASLESYP